MISAAPQNQRMKQTALFSLERASAQLTVFSTVRNSSYILNGAEIKTDAVYDENTSTVGFTVTAAPTDRITVKLNGGSTVKKPNADKICDEILRKTECLQFLKIRIIPCKIKIP